VSLYTSWEWLLKLSTITNWKYLEKRSPKKHIALELTKLKYYIFYLYGSCFYWSQTSLNIISNSIYLGTWSARMLMAIIFQCVTYLTRVALQTVALGLLNMLLWVWKVYNSPFFRSTSQNVALKMCILLATNIITDVQLEHYSEIWSPYSHCQLIQEITKTQ